MDVDVALDRIAFLLERSQASTHRVRAFRNAAVSIRQLGPAEVLRRSTLGTLGEIAGLGPTTVAVALEALNGQVPQYLAGLEVEADHPLVADAQPLLQLLQGDLHTHSDWSDGGSPVDVMATTARDLGRHYIALTDHSPRLKVAHGLTAERLAQQLDVVATINQRMAPFRLLTGIEVDILDDGALDQSDELLTQVDIVVASVHSKLRMGSAAMTARLVAAIANPHTNVLGHCTGRLITSPGRPASEFDAAIVFEACRRFGVAVEINSRPERLDPPMSLLRQAVAAGCLFSIDSDAHAPGQLDWLAYGSARAQQCGVPTERIVTTWGLDELLQWAHSGR